MEARSDPSTDTSAFNAGFAAAAPQLWAWIRIRIGPRLRTTLDPEDVLQEVATRAWSRYASYDPSQGELRGWLFGIARNVLAELLSKVARGGGALDWSTSNWSMLPDDATRATQMVVKAERINGVVAWLETLPDEDRKLVLYRGLEGLEHREVAELLGTSEAAAKKRWQRLRDRMQEQPGFEELL